MDELLSEINNLRPVQRDSKSLTHFATTISCYVNDMEDNGCPVLEAAEAPFFMSQLLSKLDLYDNEHFGREMRRDGKEENVRNLIAWLHQEASIRSRGKSHTGSAEQSERRREKGSKKTDNNAADGEETDDETCPLGCKAKHHLAACPTFQILTKSGELSNNTGDVESVKERITRTNAKNQMAQHAIKKPPPIST